MCSGNYHYTEHVFCCQERICYGVGPKFLTDPKGFSETLRVLPEIWDALFATGGTNDGLLYVLQEAGVV
jgi:hypothetical protein